MELKTYSLAAIMQVTLVTPKYSKCVDVSHKVEVRPHNSGMINSDSGLWSAFCNNSVRMALG